MMNRGLFGVILALGTVGCRPAGGAEIDLPQWRVLGHAEEAGLLAFVNDPGTDRELLDAGCEIRRDSAWDIIDQRDVAPFESADELRELDTVDPWTIDQLLACADAFGFMPSADELAVLALVNDRTETDLARLDIECALRRDSAANLIAHRDGPDGIPGTVDDDLFDDMVEVEDVPMVGPETLRRLTICATGHGPTDLRDGARCLDHRDCASGLCAGLTVGDGLCQPAWMVGTYTSNERFELGDDSEGVVSSIAITGQASHPVDVIASIQIDHPRPADLLVELRQPGGAQVTLWNHLLAPPAEVVVKEGIDRDYLANGTWHLIVTDTATGAEGALLGWSLWISSRR